MKKSILIFFAILFFKVSNGQSGFKQEGAMSFNPVVAYQSLFKTTDIDAKLIANNFSKLSTPNFSIGFEFAAVDAKTILKTHIRATGLFVKESTLQTVTIAIQYGRDLFKQKEKTFFYPFIGFRWFDHTLIGESTDGKMLDAWKINFDFMAGFGLKHFFNTELRGVFNNLDISLGASLPAINGKWKEDGAEFVTGTYKLKPTYYLTFSIGRGFRPATIR